MGTCDRSSSRLIAGCAGQYTHECPSDADRHCPSQERPLSQRAIVNRIGLASGKDGTPLGNSRKLNMATTLWF
jgi:hypothetical protein